MKHSVYWKQNNKGAGGRQKTAAIGMPQNKTASPDLNPVIFLYSIRICILLFGFTLDRDV